MRRLSKISLLFAAVLMVGIAVGMPFLHHHPDTCEEQPVECIANIVENHLNGSQPAQAVAVNNPLKQTSHLAIAVQETAFSAFSGFLFINKAPPALV